MKGLGVFDWNLIIFEQKNFVNIVKQEEWEESNWDENW